jgi:hypothetical protein
MTSQVPAQDGKMGNQQLRPDGLSGRVLLMPLMRLGLVWLLASSVVAEERTPAANDSSPRYVIGLSPFLDSKVKDEVYRQIVRFLLEDMPLKSSLWICDAYYLQTIARIDVPEVRAFHSAKTRANQFKDQIRKLKEFLATEPERLGAPVPVPPQAVRLPQFTDFVGANLRDPHDGVVVVVLGSPLYVDAKEPHFSMLDGYFPSDGHLMASREESLFGLKGRTNALRDMIVHFGWFGDPWVSEVHQDRIQRFWTLYLQQQGAQLATFCGDLPTVFKLAAVGPAGNETANPRPAIDPAQSKIEMLRITRDVGLADWITRDVLPRIEHEPPAHTVGSMKIGIRWKGDIDLDLYSRPTETAEPLFFEHMRSPEGYYFKDHRSSPDREYEFIEFEKPVDVGQAEAKINFYEGSAPDGTSGEIRIEFDGKIYSGQFSLEADHGNQGRTGRSQNRFWTHVDIPALLKLREPGAGPNAERSASAQ